MRSSVRAKRARREVYIQRINIHVVLMQLLVLTPRGEERQPIHEHFR